MSKFGIGSVWAELMRTSSHAISATGSVASAMDATAKNLEKSAWLNSAKSAQDLCNELGVKAEDGQPLDPATAIQTTDKLLTMLRGY